MARIYCGTYAKYAAGSLRGKWIKLDQLEDEVEFWGICYELHKDESDPEFMFQDFEGFPRCMYQEAGIHPQLFDYLKFDDSHEGRAKEAFMEIWNEWDEDKFRDSLIGEFDSREDFVTEHLSESGFFEGARPEFEQYFDFESYGRDMEMNGTISEHNGFYFWR